MRSENRDDDNKDEYPLDKLTPAQLEALSDLPPEDIRALKRDRASRREWIKGGAALAAGLGLGGGAAAGLDDVVGAARADASTTDSDGDIGTPSNRIDMFADGLDAVSVDTDEIYTAGDIRITRNDGSLIERLDPSATSAPIRDARDIIAATSEAAGTIELPPGGVPAAGETILDTANLNDITIKGQGLNKSAIDVPAGSKGIVFDDMSNVKFENWVLRGAGDGSGNPTDQGAALSYEGGNMQQHNYDNFRIFKWGGPATDSPNGHTLFDSSWGLVSFDRIDAGNDDAVVQHNFGAGFDWDLFAASPDDGLSGTDSRLIDVPGSSAANIDLINVGGSVAAIYSGDVSGTTNANLRIGRINWEPSTQNTTPEFIIRLSGQTNTRIGSLNIIGTADYAYRIEGDGNGNVADKYMARPNGQPSLNNNAVDVQTDPSRPTVKYGGASGDVDNNTGSGLSNGISCLGDQTIVS
jgi:hypothetical protein